MPAGNTEGMDLGNTSMVRLSRGRKQPGRRKAEVTSGLGILANSYDDTDTPVFKKIHVCSRQAEEIQGLISRYHHQWKDFHQSKVALDKALGLALILYKHLGPTPSL